VNILPNKSGGKLFTLLFSIFTPKSVNISPKNANLQNFFTKNSNFEKFSTSESEKNGEIFSQFFRRQGKK